MQCANSFAETDVTHIIVELAGSEQQNKPRFTEGTKHMKGLIVQDDACSYVCKHSFEHEWQLYYSIRFTQFPRCLRSKKPTMIMQYHCIINFNIQIMYIQIMYNYIHDVVTIIMNISYTLTL